MARRGKDDMPLYDKASTLVFEAAPQP